MGRIKGVIVDAVSGEKVVSKVQVISSNGRFLKPPGSIEKRGPGSPFFYSDGEFEVQAPRGQVDVIVERGTEYQPSKTTFDVAKQGTKDVIIELKRWIDLPQAGWYPGNTHIHYDEKEERPYDRLAFDSKVEAYNVTVVSILKRWDLEYASNRFPLGIMNEYSTAHHVVDIGEENRHNDTHNRSAYGHVMFLRIRNQIDPVSRGFLVDDFHPDYPPLCWACDEARDQGGIVLWCHNGQGMEAPIAAVLGKLDAFNLFDPFWMDPEYDIWYRLMNCGIKLPASTGTDWFVCSNNRVYVQMDEKFGYDGWIEGMQKGRTFITNGPALFLDVEDKGPGDTVQFRNERKVNVRVTWRSHYPIDRLAIIHNGRVAKRRRFREGSYEGEWEAELLIDSNGWIAVRCNGTARDSYNQAVFAHTSPVYLENGKRNESQKKDAAFFLKEIDQSKEWVQHTGRFTADEQREAVLELFEKGRKAYETLAKG